MTMQTVVEAMQRVEAVLRRRPALGMQEDAPATASWCGATRTVVGHASGTRIETDMPTEIGGTGDCVTPGWLFRAGVASCAATSIAMAAAAEGIELDSLEVVASSSSDTRGMLGMPGDDGMPVNAGPSGLMLRVRIGARDVGKARLLAIVDDGCRRSPIPSAVQQAVPLTLRVEVD